MLVLFLVAWTAAAATSSVPARGHVRTPPRASRVQCADVPTVEVLTDAGTLADGERLASALARLGERAHVASAADVPGERTALGAPIFAVVRRASLFADLVRAVPAERRADLVLIGDTAALLFASLARSFTAEQQAQLTIAALEPAALFGEMPLQAALVRGRHAPRTLALLAELGVPCAPEASAGMIELHLCETLIAASALWLVCAAAGVRSPAEVRKSDAWLAELHDVVADDLLPAARRLATGKAVLDALRDARLVVDRLLRAHVGTHAHVGDARRAWAERNGLLLSTEPDRSAQPHHRHLLCLAGQLDVLQPTSGSEAMAERAEPAATPPVAPGAVFAAEPGGGLDSDMRPSLHRAVILILDASPAGVTALVLNRPTPILVSALAGETGRYQAFGDNVLHAGGELGAGDTTPASSPLLPIYWLHSCEWLPEARELARGTFAGGDSEMLAAAVGGGTLAASDVRFFWGDVAFRPDELEAQLQRGCWRRLPAHAWQVAC